MVEANDTKQQEHNLAAAKNLYTYLTLIRQASEDSSERLSEDDLRWTERMVYQLY